jgi:ankyrin repeat protein
MCPEYENIVHGNLLEFACYNNKLDVIKYLIESRKMSPYVILKDGANLLEYAYYHNNKDIIDYLVNEQNMSIKYLSYNKIYIICFFILLIYIMIS